MVRKVLLFFLVLGFSGPCFAESELDSLLGQYEIETNLERRLVLISDMIKNTVFVEGDTAWHFIEMYELEAQRQENTIELARAENFRGIFYAVKDDYEKAIQYYLKALDFYKVANDTMMIGMMYNNIGGAYGYREDLENERDFYNKALEYFEMSNNQEWIINSYFNIGVTEDKLERFDEARSYFFKALENIEAYEGDYSDYNPEYIKGRVLSGIATSYYRQNLFEEANFYYNQAYDFLIQNKQLDGRVDLLSNMAQCNIEFGDLEKAQKCIEEAQIVAESKKSLYAWKRVYESSYLLARKRKEYKSALEYSEKYLIYKDSIQDQKKDEQLLEVLTKYQTLEKEKKIEIQNVKIEENAKQKNLFIVILVVAGLLLLSIGVSLINRTRTNKKLKEQKEIIEKALGEKELLLKEIHHRVKNNLQVVSSLLSIQSRKIKDEQAQEAIQESRNRVKSMTLIHQDLYQEDNLKGIDSSQYIEKLSRSLFNSYRVDENRIKLKTNVEALNLDVDTTIPLGLILNELLTNSLKYAFPGEREGEINITLKEQEEVLLLKIADDGVGMDQAQVDENSTSFGMNMLGAFAKKLNASFDIKSENGTEVSMMIKKYKVA